MMVLCMNNGGVSWSLFFLFKMDKVIVIFFVFLEKGWILIMVDIFIGKQDKKLYVIEDGGIIWKEMLFSDEDDQLVLVEILICGYIIGLIFLDLKYGFLIVFEFGILKLYVMIDGGENWKIGLIFFDWNDFNGCGNFNMGLLQFFGWEVKGVWMFLICFSGDYIKFNGYFIDDGGKSWMLLIFGLNKQKGINCNFIFVFLNVLEGWVVQLGMIYQIKDLGKSWKVFFGSKVLDGILEDYLEIVKLQMVFLKFGWILVENMDIKRFLFLQIVDGGLQWKVLQVCCKQVLFRREIVGFFFFLYIL